MLVVFMCLSHCVCTMKGVYINSLKISVWLGIDMVKLLYCTTLAGLKFAQLELSKMQTFQPQSRVL